MANIKLKACDICAAVTDKRDEEFHLQWHRELAAQYEYLERAMRELLERNAQ